MEDLPDGVYVVAHGCLTAQFQSCPGPTPLNIHILLVCYHSGWSMKLNACNLLLAHMVYL
jgi:hypothetical protein